MILAIDTASKTASVALTEGGSILAEYSVLSEKTHSKAVLPMIRSLFSAVGKEPSDIEYIACVNGPGSFTGLRIGASIAKGLAFSLNKKIVPVSSLDTLAYNVFICSYTICPIIDARRGHVYACFYSYENGGLTRRNDYITAPLKEVVNIGSSFGQELYFIGSGAEMYEQELKELSPNAKFAPKRLNMHRAGVLGVYAHDCKHMLEPVDSSGFAPVYMSRSQVEEENV